MKSEECLTVEDTVAILNRSDRDGSDSERERGMEIERKMKMQ
jgi:hypothetical protein